MRLMRNHRKRVVLFACIDSRRLESDQTNPGAESIALVDRERLSGRVFALHSSLDVSIEVPRAL